MKLESKFALFTGITKIILILAFVLVIPFIIQYVAKENTESSLLSKKGQVLELILKNGIEEFLSPDGETETFGSYNILKEEFILLEPFEGLAGETFFEETQRIIEGETVDYTVLTHTFEYNGRIYLLEIGKSLSSLGNFDDALQKFALIILFSMAFLSVIASLIYTKILLKPFSRIIHKKLKVTSNPLSFDPSPITTSTTDFKFLDSSINEMMEKLLAAFNKEREFNANVSHELLTPVSILQNRLENLLQETSLSNKGLQKIADCLKTLNRLKSIIHTLLTISRIENTQFEKTDKVSLKELLTEATEPLQEKYEMKGVVFETKIHEDLSMDGCNKQLLFTLLSNLLDNAGKFNKAASKVYITSQKENGRFCLSIRDNGQGIEKENLKDIFLRFKKFHKNENSGYGLGLSIVKAIADFHNITLEVESEIGTGSEFKLKFPAKV
jgi:signal transduction histidine kinase